MVRSNKNAPMEVSSKQPVSVLREVIPAVRKKAIDPRFDRTFGHFNEDLFQKTYGFLGESQKQEVDMLRQALKTELNPFKRESLKSTITRITSMKKSKDINEQRQQIIREHRKLDAKLVEQGKTPYFLKEGDINKLTLVKKFETAKKQLGDAADLEKFIEKRRKRKASKQKKFMPRQLE